MKPFLFVLFAGCTALLACSSVKKVNSSDVEQGIKGRITEETGNRMPRPGSTPAVPKGISTTVLVYEPTHISQVTRTGNAPSYTAIATKQVASVNTDSTGNFTLLLPPGTYSIFIKQGKQFYANLFDAKNNIAVFTVEPGKLTQVDLKVSTNAVY